MAENSKKILIVDDERMITRVLARKLENNGFVTRIVLDGDAALKVLAQESFDLILLDLVMPNKDGFTVLQELRDKNNTIPIIVTSNLSQDEDIARAKQLGAQHYFVKADTMLEDIVTKIKTMLV